jgi:uncharacterized metal-binding protein
MSTLLTSSTPPTPPTLIFACSGAADVGEIADRAARQLTRQGAGKMFCVAAIGAQVPDMVDKAKSAGKVAVIDGCEKACATKCMERAGIKDFSVTEVTALGMEKFKSPCNGERVDKVVCHVAKLLA